MTQGQYTFDLTIKAPWTQKRIQAHTRATRTLNQIFILSTVSALIICNSALDNCHKNSMISESRELNL